MKVVGLQIVFAAVLGAMPAAAQATGAKVEAPSGNMFDRLWSSIGSITGPDSTEQSPRATKGEVAGHANAEGGDAAGDPAPLRSSDADTSDKDSYKPDIGDPGH